MTKRRKNIYSEDHNSLFACLNKASFRKRAVYAFLVFLYSTVVLLDSFHHHHVESISSYSNYSRSRIVFLNTPHGDSDQECAACAWNAVSSSPSVTINSLCSFPEVGKPYTLLYKQHHLIDIGNSLSQGRAPPAA